jgi:NMD protein affecting ribosome stability and mRNA decay
MMRKAACGHLRVNVAPEGARFTTNRCRDCGRSVVRKGKRWILKTARPSR